MGGDPPLSSAAPQQADPTRARLRVPGVTWTWDYPREFKDTPSENAFCLVAPTVLLRDLAIFPVSRLARLVGTRSRVAQGGKLDTAAGKERVRGDEEGICPVAYHRKKTFPMISNQPL
jgi:hypothetical protein